MIPPLLLLTAGPGASDPAPNLILSLDGSIGVTDNVAGPPLDAEDVYGWDDQSTANNDGTGASPYPVYDAFKRAVVQQAGLTPYESKLTLSGITINLANGFSFFAVIDLNTLRKDIQIDTYQCLASSSSPDPDLKLAYSGDSTSSNFAKLAAITGSETITMNVQPYAGSRVLIGWALSANATLSFVNGLSASGAPLTNAAYKITQLLGHLTAGSVDHACNSSVRQIWAYNKAVTAADVAAYILPMAQALGVGTHTSQIVIEGDSRTAGVNSTANRCWGQLLTLPATVRRNIVAQSGITLATLATDRAKTSALFQSGMTNVGVIYAGVNDLLSNVSGATMYANTLQMSQDKISAGFTKNVWVPEPTGSFTAPQETERQAYNALLAANAAGNNAIYVTEMATFVPSGLHPTTTEQGVIAGIIQPYIVTALGLSLTDPNAMSGCYRNWGIGTPNQCFKTNDVAAGVGDVLTRWQDISTRFVSAAAFGTGPTRRADGLQFGSGKAFAESTLALNGAFEIWVHLKRTTATFFPIIGATAGAALFFNTVNTVAFNDTAGNFSTVSMNVTGDSLMRVSRTAANQPIKVIATGFSELTAADPLVGACAFNLVGAYGDQTTFFMGANDRLSRILIFNGLVNSAGDRTIINNAFANNLWGDGAVSL